MMYQPLSKFASDCSANSQLKQCKAKIRRIGIELADKDKCINYEQFLQIASIANLRFESCDNLIQIRSFFANSQDKVNFEYLLNQMVFIEKTRQNFIIVQFNLLPYSSDNQMSFNQQVEQFNDNQDNGREQLEKQQQQQVNQGEQDNQNIVNSSANKQQIHQQSQQQEKQGQYLNQQEKQNENNVINKNKTSNDNDKQQQQQITQTSPQKPLQQQQQQQQQQQNQQQQQKTHKKLENLYKTQSFAKPLHSNYQSKQIQQCSELSMNIKSLTDLLKQGLSSSLLKQIYKQVSQADTSQSGRIDFHQFIEKCQQLYKSSFYLIVERVLLLSKESSQISLAKLQNLIKEFKTLEDLFNSKNRFQLTKNPAVITPTSATNPTNFDESYYSEAKSYHSKADFSPQQILAIRKNIQTIVLICKRVLGNNFYTFKYFDKDNSERVTFQNFNTACKRLMINLKYNQLYEIFQYLDKKQQGYLTLTEFNGLFEDRAKTPDFIYTDPAGEGGGQEDSNILALPDITKNNLGSTQKSFNASIRSKSQNQSYDDGRSVQFDNFSPNRNIINQFTPKINYKESQNQMSQSVTQIISPEFVRQQRAHPILNRTRDDISDSEKHLDPIPSDYNYNYTYGWRKPPQDTMKSLIQYQPISEYLDKMQKIKSSRNQALYQYQRYQYLRRNNIMNRAQFLREEYISQQLNKTQEINSPSQQKPWKIRKFLKIPSRVQSRCSQEMPLKKIGISNKSFDLIENQNGEQIQQPPNQELREGNKQNTFLSKSQILDKNPKLDSSQFILKY